MNASHSLVLCLNTTGEQPMCSCSTASPLQQQREAKARLGKGKTLPFPPVCVPALVDSCFCSEHPLLQDRTRSGGSQNPQLQSGCCWGAAVGVHWVTPFPPELAKNCGLMPRRQGLHPTHFQVCLSPCLLLHKAGCALNSL